MSRKSEKRDRIQENVRTRGLSRRIARTRFASGQEILSVLILNEDPVFLFKIHEKLSNYHDCTIDCSMLQDWNLLLPTIDRVRPDILITQNRFKRSKRDHPDVIASVSRFHPELKIVVICKKGEEPIRAVDHEVFCIMTDNSVPGDLISLVKAQGGIR